MIKTLLKSVREYKKASILSPLFVSGEVILECIIPIYTALIINNLQEGCDMNLIMKYGGILIIMAFASLFFGIMSARYSAIAAAGFAKNLRHDVFEKIQNFSFKNIDKFSPPSLISRLTTDVNNVYISYMMIIRVAVRSPLMMIFAIIMSIQVGKKLAWVFVGVVPILVVGLGGIAVKAMPVFRRIFKKYDKLNESVEENVKAMRVVKAYVREDYEIEKFTSASDEIRKDFTKATSLLAFNAPIMQFCIYGSNIFISYFAARLIIGTRGSYLNIGSLTSMITYSMQVMMSLMFLSMIFVMITMSIASAQRLVEILDEEPTIKNPANPITEVKDGSIDFKNVNFNYSKKAKKRSLYDINLHIESGQTIGILGSTGSGKSSLVQLIPRLYDANEGGVYVGGVDVREYDKEVLRDNVAMVLQKNVLFAGSIKENMRWGDPNASDEEIERICKLAQADEFIQTFPGKYDYHIEQGGNNVSGGQKQRLCIARAILKKPKILILDDSTSAVDTKTDALIRKAFREEIPNTTKIIIAQRVSSVQDADLIIILDDGRIVARGTHEELLKSNEMYKDLYESQNKAGGLDE